MGTAASVTMPREPGRRASAARRLSASPDAHSKSAPPKLAQHPRACSACSATALSETPSNSRIRVGPTGRFGMSLAYALNAATVPASRISHRATGIEDCKRSVTADAASARVGKRQEAAAPAGGMACRRRVTSVMTARVPSDPISSRVKSYPAELLRARPPVRITSPEASTAVRPSTFSRMVPYRTAEVPEAPVATMPPMEASAPGSTEK
eukprot:scaffold21262_cov30-Tisochrysis_lutea.AAC.2